MDPSSLIFVVIVAIWAVYLLGHWVRRRDLLATARSVDRFSEAMRVLERRVPQPVAAPRSRSYVVAPSRLPEQATNARVAVDRQLGGRPAADRPAGRPGTGRQNTARPVGRSATARPAGRPATARRAGRPSPRPDAAANRARALVLLGLLVLVPGGWLLTAVTSLPVWVPTVLTLALVAHVLRLRQVAMRRRELERRRARAARAGAGGGGRARSSERGQVSATRLDRGRAHESRPSAPARSGATEVGADGADPAERRVPDDSTDGSHVAAARPDDRSMAATRSEPAGSGLETAGSRTVASEQAGAAVATVESEADFAAPPGDGTAIAAAAGSGWQPIPVPPPTYTLKPKAPAPVQRPAPAGVPATGDGRGPSGEASDPDAGFDLDQIIERRIAAGG